MNTNDFQLVSRVVKERSGLMLSEDKAYLLESRLNPVARRYGFKGIDELVQAIRLGKDEALLKDATEAMTTNESFFFRDTRPFDQFRDIVLPHILTERATKKSFRIWSAACSNGQEPYSLAMVIKEKGAALAGWNIDIIATDLSDEVLTKAREGSYTQFEVQRGLPINLLVKYFKQEGDLWRIDEGLRRMVTFKPFNLLNSPACLGGFDVVFCRNVLIYFDRDTKSSVLSKIAKLMPSDGFLYLGGAETVLGISDRFELMPSQRGIYCLTGKAETVRVAAAG